nr:MAG TPA: hypothetical protein [Caudoviricetes sp.]
MLSLELNFEQYLDNLQYYLWFFLLQYLNQEVSI